MVDPEKKRKRILEAEASASQETVVYTELSMERRPGTSLVKMMRALIWLALTRLGQAWLLLILRLLHAVLRIALKRLSSRRARSP